MDKQLQELQDKFALIDLMSRGSKSGYLEILIKKLRRIELRIEQDPNHRKSPHIHINYGREKHVASYRLTDGVRLAGSLDTKYDKIVKDWILQNNVALIDIFDNIQSGNETEYSLLIDQLQNE